MHMPKMIRFSEFGGPEVLKTKDEPSKQPGKGEVRIKVQAAGLNRAESMFFRGQYIEQPNLPSGVGYEAAGVGAAGGPGRNKKRESQNGPGVSSVSPMAPPPSVGKCNGPPPVRLCDS